MILLIPAYEPGQPLLNLITDVKDKCPDMKIVIVNDGSSKRFEEIFDSAREMGCDVLTHSENRGKGAALKTGFNLISRSDDYEGIVCADCDGQHRPYDILRVARAINRNPKAIVLGIRRFSSQVPARSRLGNRLTSMFFRLVTGQKLDDTQTGLRGYSYRMLPWLCSIRGDRYEYEMSILLEAPGAGYCLEEVEIETLYLNGNKSSHFRVCIDSARIYWPLLKFCSTSIISALIDFIAVMIIAPTTSNLLLAVVGARVLSSIFNYTSNRIFVFADHKNHDLGTSLPRYYTLAIIILALNYLLMSLFTTTLGVPLFNAKVFTEAMLFALSYWSQRRFVFGPA